MAVRRLAAILAASSTKDRPLNRATILAAAILSCFAPAHAHGAPAALVASGPLSFAPLARRVVPAVVNIAVTESVASDQDAVEVPPALRGTPFEKQFRDRMRARREIVLGAGSGFIIDPSGIIVTNNHVVGNADKIVVSLANGRQLDARVLGSDELTDIAVIKVNSNGPLPFVTWGDSTGVEVGDWVLAAGNPFGLGSSITAGIVSARGRDIGAGPFDDFLQLDAPINPGNSGGPSFNMAGQDKHPAVNGDHVDNARGLIRSVARAAPGSSISLAVLRRGKPTDFPVVVGRRPADHGE